MQHSKVLLAKGVLSNRKMITQSQIPNTKFRAQICNLKNFIDALKAMNFQMDVLFSMDMGGLQVTAEDSNCFQAVLYVTMSAFTEYELQGIAKFRINLNVLCDIIGIFYNQGSLRMIYKGDGAPFVLLMEDASNFNCITECSIKTQNESTCLDLQFNEDNTRNNRIILKAADLMEILNEIDKSCEEIQLTLSPDAPFFRLRTVGVIQSETDFEMDKISDSFIAFDCRQRTCFRYKTSHIKLLMRSLALASKVALSTDNSGLLNCQVILMVSSEDRMTDDPKIYIEYFLLPLSSSQDHNEDSDQRGTTPIHIR